MVFGFPSKVRLNMFARSLNSFLSFSRMHRHQKSFFMLHFCPCQQLMNPNALSGRRRRNLEVFIFNSLYLPISDTNLFVNIHEKKHHNVIRITVSRYFRIQFCVWQQRKNIATSVYKTFKNIFSDKKYIIHFFDIRLHHV